MIDVKIEVDPWLAEDEIPEEERRMTRAIDLVATFQLQPVNLDKVKYTQHLNVRRMTLSASLLQVIQAYFKRAKAELNLIQSDRVNVFDAQAQAFRKKILADLRRYGFVRPFFGHFDSAHNSLVYWKE